MAKSSKSNANIYVLEFDFLAKLQNFFPILLSSAGFGGFQEIPGYINSNYLIFLRRIQRFESLQHLSLENKNL